MPNFNYNPPFPGAVQNSASTYVRRFVHRDWVDLQDVVQAGSTPQESGINARMHAIEADLDAVRADLQRAYQLIADLRSALAVALVQARDEINKKTDKPSKEGKEGKEVKDTKEGKDTKDGKETKETKDGKETKEGKDRKDGKETKEGKEDKDGKEAVFKEKDNPRENRLDNPLHLFGGSPTLPELESEPTDAVGHAFIRPHERPHVGERLMRESEPAE